MIRLHLVMRATREAVVLGATIRKIQLSPFARAHLKLFICSQSTRALLRVSRGKDEAKPRAALIGKLLGEDMTDDDHTMRDVPTSLPKFSATLRTFASGRHQKTTLKDHARLCSTCSSKADPTSMISSEGGQEIKVDNSTLTSHSRKAFTN